MLGFQLAGQALNRCSCSFLNVLSTWRKVYAMFSNTWTVFSYQHVTPLSMLSYAKSMASRAIYHYIVYRCLVCLYCLDDGNLHKCIIQELSHDKIAITNKSAVSISGQAVILPTDTVNDSISLEMNVHSAKETDSFRQSKLCPTVRSDPKETGSCR